MRREKPGPKRRTPDMTPFESGCPRSSDQAVIEAVDAALGSDKPGSPAAASVPAAGPKPLLPSWESAGREAAAHEARQGAPAGMLWTPDGPKM